MRSNAGRNASSRPYAIGSPHANVAEPGRELDDWVADVRTTGPPELRGFSRNLQHDWPAVHAGLTERWSSGSVEGNVNKLKVTKRQMFGRARFDLLRKRVLLAN